MALNAEQRREIWMSHASMNPDTAALTQTGSLDIDNR